MRHDGRQPLAIPRGLHESVQFPHQRVLIRQRLATRLPSGAAHARELDVVPHVHQRAEDRRHLGGRTVAREQAAHVNLAMARGEDLANPLEARRALTNRLVLVAKQKEVGSAEELGEHAQLSGRVVLHLIDHHVAGIARPAPADQQAQVEEFRGGEGLLAECPHAQAIQAQPGELVDLPICLGLEQLLHVLAALTRRLGLVGGVRHKAEQLYLLFNVEAEHALLPGFVARHASELLIQAIMQLVGHQGHELRSQAELLALAHHGRDLGR